MFLLTYSKSAHTPSIEDERVKYQRLSEKLFLHGVQHHLTAISVQIVVNGWNKEKKMRECVCVPVHTRMCI